jgi:hypothetical protein
MATEVIAPEDGRRVFRRLLPRRDNWLTYTLVLLVVLVVGAVTGMVYATYSYAQRYEDRLLPGTNIAGVEVGGLSRDEALARVETAIQPRLEEPVTLTWRDKTWEVTPADVDARSDAEAVVDGALIAADEVGFLDFARMRFVDADVGPTDQVAIGYKAKAIRDRVASLAKDFRRPPKDAALDYSTGWVEISEAREGRRVKVGATASGLLEAFRGGEPQVPLAVKALKPEVTSEAFDKVLLLRIGENKLYLYEKGEITNEWVVATGQPEFPTPTGEYTIELKRYMPTWVNPAPDGWGKSMPKEIGPGPSNPLGTRALNWTAAGIRFHGTQATYSLGRNASHGCVRLARADVEALYDMVDVGTRIVSIDVGGWDPLYEDGPDLASAEED